MPLSLMARRRLAEKFFSELSIPTPQSRGINTMRRALGRGERETLIDWSGLREAIHAREEHEAAFDTVAYGVFLANVLLARNARASAESRADAIERLVPALRPDWVPRIKQLLPAAERRLCLPQDGEYHPAAGRLLDKVIRAAIAEVVMTLDQPRSDVSLSPKRFGRLRKFTTTVSGEAIVPNLHLHETDLSHVMRARVREVVELEFADEIAEMGSKDHPHGTAPISIEWTSTLGQGAKDLAARKYGRPGEYLCVQPVGLGASFVRGEKRVWPPTSRRKDEKVELAGYVAEPDGTLVSVEALHARGVHALDSLDAAATLRPQRAAKVAEIRRLATKDQIRLIDAILNTGFRELADIAGVLGKGEGAVRQLLFELRARVAVADAAPPSWTHARTRPLRVCWWCGLPAAQADHFTHWSGTSCVGSRQTAVAAAASTEFGGLVNVTESWAQLPWDDGPFSGRDAGAEKKSATYRYWHGEPSTSADWGREAAQRTASQERALESACARSWDRMPQRHMFYADDGPSRAPRGWDIGQVLVKRDKELKEINA